jgi:hypothetical protein
LLDLCTQEASTGRRTRHAQESEFAEPATLSHNLAEKRLASDAATHAADSTS